MRKCEILLGCLMQLILLVSVNAQPSQVQSFLPKITAASPEASSFARFGNYEVNMFTGLPDISIPLYEVKVGEITIPISINYHASGIKVTDPGSWVGIGWSLNAGGMITRKLMGKPDEGQGNYLRGSTVRTTGSININDGTDLNYLHDIYRERKDCDPDIFSYNLGNKSGKFVFNQNDIAHPVIIPYSPIVVNSSFTGDYMNMDIIDDGGILYRYDVKEFTTNCSSSCPTSTSAWKVSKILSANKQDTVYFSYSSRYGQISTDDIDYITLSDNFNNISCTPYQADVQTTYHSSISTSSDEKNISEILFPNGKVVFETNATNRTDINGSKILNHIKIYNRNVWGNYQLIKTITFFQSYFTTSQAPPGQGRLKLDSLRTFDKSGVIMERFRFEYNAPTLPVLNKRARDYWGYYNAKNNNVLVPNMQVDYYSVPQNPPTTVTVGSTVPNSREPDPAYNQNCMLKRIYFPTGGYTDFEFETNQYYDDVTSSVKNGGGLRVKTVKSYDGITSNPILKTYKYGVNESGYGRANFILLNSFFTRVQTNRYFSFEFNGPSKCATKRFRTFLSNSSIDLEPYDGATVVYTNVTEYSGDATGQLGRTLYEFTDNPDGLSSTMITGKPIITSYHFNRGLLQAKTVYKKEGLQYIKVNKTTNIYGAYPENFVQNLGIAVGKMEINDVDGVSDVDLGVGTGSPPFYNDSYNYYFVNYSIRTGDNKLKQTVNYVYNQDDETKTLVTTTDYLYENFSHQQLTKVNTTVSNIASSDNIKTVTKKYPHDFSSTAPYSSMIPLNIINKVIEEKSLLNTTTQLSKQLNNYSSVGNNNYLPSTIQFQKGNNTLETRAEILQYDTRGNILEMRKAGDVSSSFIWDYKNIYQVAEVANASQNQIAYTSFEADGKGNWTFSGVPFWDGSAPTGKKVYGLLNNSITRTGVNATGNYYVSYWSKNGIQSVSNTSSTTTGRTLGSWVLYEHKVVNPTGGLITVSGSGTIDELRLYPEGALMTTMTYQPLVGMTSMANPMNHISYYEYDDFGRLMLVRDQDLRVLKKICYNYSEQTENCNIFYNVQKSGPFTRNNNTCPPGNTGGSITYVVPANVYSAYTQLKADALAQDDVNANGQAYADAAGTCTPIPITIQGYNVYSSNYRLQLTNTVTSQVYSFTLTANTFGLSNLGTVPAGTYNVLFQPLATPVTATFKFNSFTYFGFGGASFSNVSVTSTSQGYMY